MNNKEFSVLLLFPSPVAVIQVEEDCSNLKKIITDYEFGSVSAEGSYGSTRTKKLNVLDDFSREKNIIINYFNSYKENYLKLKNQEFVMTTSWATKTNPQGFCRYHNHTNSVYSGIFYFDEIDGGNLQFESFGIYPEQISLQNPEEWTEINSRSWSISPEKNKLVFFPSYLYHKICENDSSRDRYSIAFNFFPRGFSGSGGDSSVYFV